MNIVARQATYHTDADPRARRLEVLKTNPNGTVDLGRVDDGKKIVVIGSCPVSDTPKVGHCILDAEEVKAPKAVTKKIPKNPVTPPTPATPPTPLPAS